MIDLAPLKDLATDYAFFIALFVIPISAVILAASKLLKEPKPPELPAEPSTLEKDYYALLALNRRLANENQLLREELDNDGVL